MNKFWIQTFVGGAFDFDNPRPEQVKAYDVAHALANICRFTGHTRKFYSVAEHCVRMSLAMEAAGYSPYLCYWALIHDAPEAYIGDVSYPLKQMLPDYKRIEEAVEWAVYKAFGVRELQMPPEVKAYDWHLLATEKRDLLETEPRDWDYPGRALDFTIEPWLPEVAEANWLARYAALSGMLEAA